MRPFRTSVAIAPTRGSSLGSDFHVFFIKSLRGSVHPDCCVLGALLSNCQEQAPQLRYKQTCASAFHGWNASDLFIVIRILLLQHIDRSLASRRVDPFPGRIIEHVV